MTNNNQMFIKMRNDYPRVIIENGIFRYPSTDEPLPSTSREMTPNTGKPALTIRMKDIFIRDILVPATTRKLPLPLLSWANNEEFWQTMIYKEEANQRTKNCHLFDDPTRCLPRMRAILVDWLMEVSEVYHLRRVTYYLAVDYLDRYLNSVPSVPKSQLQLVGITSLFTASKIEEVYPPRLSEFSYVCDGACSENDIIDFEIVLLNALGWDLNPMIPSGWLNLYLQLYYAKNSNEAEEQRPKDFFFSQYSSYDFIRASYLIDLFSMDPSYLLFTYSVIAASALFYVIGQEATLDMSGLTWKELQDCVKYMAVFYNVIRDSDDPRLESVMGPDFDHRQEEVFRTKQIWIPQLDNSDSFSIQTHVVNMYYFEKATFLRLKTMGFDVSRALLYIGPKVGTPEKEKDEVENYDIGEDYDDSFDFDDCDSYDYDDEDEEDNEDDGGNKQEGKNTVLVDNYDEQAGEGTKNEVSPIETTTHENIVSLLLDDSVTIVNMEISLIEDGPKEETIKKENSAKTKRNFTVEDDSITMMEMEEALVTDSNYRQGEKRIKIEDNDEQDKENAKKEPSLDTGSMEKTGTKSILKNDLEDDHIFMMELEEALGTDSNYGQEEKRTNNGQNEEIAKKEASLNTETVRESANKDGGDSSVGGVSVKANNDGQDEEKTKIDDGKDKETGKKEASSNTADKTKKETKSVLENDGIILFEIERVLDAHDNKSGKENLSYFSAKKRYTFDEILAEIHNHTKNVLAPISSNKLDEVVAEPKSDN